MLVVALGILSVLFGARWGFSGFSNGWVWGLSIVEVGAAAWLLHLHLREAIPGNRLNWPIVAVTAAGAGLLHLCISWTTSIQRPLEVPAGERAELGLLCFVIELSVGLPVAFFAFYRLRQGLVAAPLRACLLGGLGAGLAGDAIWRFLCPYTQLSHLLLFHGGGLATAVGISVTFALIWAGWRRRAWRRHSA